MAKNPKGAGKEKRKAKKKIVLTVLQKQFWKDELVTTEQELANYHTEAAPANQELKSLTGATNKIGERIEEYKDQDDDTEEDKAGKKEIRDTLNDAKKEYEKAAVPLRKKLQPLQKKIEDAGDYYRKCRERNGKSVDFNMAIMIDGTVEVEDSEPIPKIKKGKADNDGKGNT